MEEIKETEEKTIIDNSNANKVFFELRKHFTEKLLLGEFSVYHIDNNIVNLQINEINFRIAVDYYRCEINLDVPFSDGNFFEYLNTEQSKEVFKNISKFGLTKAISDKESMLKQIEQELLIMKSKL
jgi:hypothetical protein